MTTYTSNDLANEALTVLTVVGTGQSPEAEDTAKVVAKIPLFLAELEDRGVCSVADPDDISVSWFRPLAELLASYCATDFATSPMTEDQRENTEARIRIMVNRGPMPLLTTDRALSRRPYGLTVASWRSGNF